MILAKQPDARMVYNLDGGGSTSLVFNNEKINTNWDVREICDMIYFASIDSAGAAHE
jgi:exopolysaccharide biosynthesis protein